ncbi:MAG: FHA domain-containing protein [Polyangiales bacterium]
MSEDLNRKSMRQFQCRDYLWDVFEQMSRELECSVDYLVNEAMRHYARSQGRIRQTNMPSQQGARPMPPMGNGPPMNRGPAPMGAQGSMAPPGRPGMPGMNGARGPTGYPPPPQQNPQRMPSMNAGYGQPAPQARPPMPMGGPAAVGGPGSVLFAVFEGQRYPITKDEFFIGRSNKSCDLIVKDPNVSRQHARVIRHQGQFWMVDMGSTNGIEFQGMRVDRRPIGEGDSFRICDHEIVFTYR